MDAKDGRLIFRVLSGGFIGHRMLLPMISIPPLSRGIRILFPALVFLLAPQAPGHAEELTSACRGLRGKELVLCWKKMDPKRARGDHEAFHKGQNALHLQWHQEHRDKTDAQVTKDHQEFHQDVAKKHQEFHRSTKVGEGGGEKKEVTTQTKPRDAQSAPNKGRSMRRQLRQ